MSEHGRHKDQQRMTISESQTSLKRLKNGSFAPASANGGQVVTDLTSPPWRVATDYAQSDAIDRSPEVAGTERGPIRMTGLRQVRTITMTTALPPAR